MMEAWEELKQSIVADVDVDDTREDEDEDWADQMRQELETQEKPNIINEEYSLL